MHNPKAMKILSITSLAFIILHCIMGVACSILVIHGVPDFIWILSPIVKLVTASLFALYILRAPQCRKLLAAVLCLLAVAPFVFQPNIFLFLRFGIVLCATLSVLFFIATVQLYKSETPERFLRIAAICGLVFELLSMCCSMLFGFIFLGSFTVILYFLCGHFGSIALLTAIFLFQQQRLR